MWRHPTRPRDLSGGGAKVGEFRPSRALAGPTSPSKPHHHHTRQARGAPLSPPSPTIIQSPALSAESLQILNDKVLTEVHTIASYSFISISDDMQGTLICMSCSKTLKGFLLLRTVAYSTFFCVWFSLNFQSHYFLPVRAACTLRRQKHQPSCCAAQIHFFIEDKSTSQFRQIHFAMWTNTLQHARFADRGTSLRAALHTVDSYLRVQNHQNN